MDPYIPQDLIDILPKLSPDPEVWFNGQLISYILRPNEKFSRQFQKFKKSPFSAAFHIRRNDKIKEAPFYNTQDYTKLINHYFKIQKAKNLLHSGARALQKWWSALLT